jgi:hypothetical protein
MEKIYGYLRDPAPCTSPTGDPIVGTRKLTLWGHDFDELDAKDLLAKLPQVQPGDVDLSKFCTETNQLSLNACAGNATADSIEMAMRITEAAQAAAQNRAPAEIPQMSRLFVYSMSRMLQDTDGDGHNDLNLDQGTYIRLCFDVLSRFGICREETWPYLTDKVFISPSMKAQREAVGHRIHSYYRIRSFNQDRVDEVVSALRANHPVVFGTQIDASFEKISNSTPVGPPTAPLGGHAMIIVGYIGGNFLIKNSWGTGWGDGGFCMMTPDYIAWSGTDDLWVPTLGTSFITG